MARIYFVESSLRNEKLGIMYLSAYLRAHGHETRLLLMDYEVSEDEPDFLCFSLCTGQEQAALGHMTRLHAQWPKAKIVVGGPHATFIPKSFEGSHLVSHVVRGEGEQQLLDIVNGVYRPHELIADLDTLPHPDRDLLYAYEPFKSSTMRCVITQRNCPHNCSYCYNHQWKALYSSQANRLYQRKSVNKTIAEVQSIRDKYPTDSIMFIDDNFAGIGPSGRVWIDEFIEEWTYEGKLPFLISLRAGEISDEQLSGLHRAGLEYVNLAIETVNSKVRTELLNRHISTANVVELVQWCRTLGIRTRVQSMVGLPIDDSLEEALATLEFVKMLSPTEAWASVFQPYPGTKLAKYCVDKGLCDVGLYDTSFFGNSVLKLPDKDKLGRLQKWWFLFAKYKIPREWIDMILDIKLPDEQAARMIELRFEHSKQELYGIGQHKQFI